MHFLCVLWIFSSIQYVSTDLVLESWSGGMAHRREIRQVTAPEMLTDEWKRQKKKKTLIAKSQYSMGSY